MTADEPTAGAGAVDATILAERARALVPALRARAQEAETLGRVPDELIDAAEDADLLAALVARRWGGFGLGLASLSTVARTLARADASIAWTIAFLMRHGALACRLPWEGQKELFADGPSIRAANALQPTGTAERVAHGFRLTGRWRYATGVLNADWVLLTAPAGTVRYTFLVPVDQLTVHDDWQSSGMVATGSGSVSADRVLVPERFAIASARFHSTDDHPGAAEADPLTRCPPMAGLVVVTASVVLGAAERVIELGRERLSEHAAWGVKRIDQPVARVRWVTAHQQIRCARLMFERLLHWTIAACRSGRPWSDAEGAQLALDRMTVAHLCKDATRTICDGAGASAYALTHPLQRYLRDVDVMANHVGHDQDSVSERSARHLLGLGPLPTDPTVPGS